MNLNKIKKHKDIKSLTGNFFSLSALNVINYLFPLIIIPYLTRVLGVENYGVYAFFYAVINYFTLFVRYGFEFSATKQVAIVRDDKYKLNRLFSSVLVARLLLIMIAVFLMLLLVHIIPKFSENRETLFSGVGIFIGLGFLPVWFFQGMEKMKYLIIVNFVARVIALILIFCFVRNNDDYSLVLLFQSIGFLVGGVFSIYLAIRYFKIALFVPTRCEISKQFKDGWHLFLSTLGMNFYRESNAIILGFLTNYTYVGYYSAAEKIVKAVQTMVNPFVITLFPYFGRKLNLSENFAFELKRFLKLGKYYVLVLSALVLGLFILSPYFITLYLGETYVNSIVNVRIMSIIVLLGGFNYYFGIIGLVNIGYQKYFTGCVWMSGVLSVFVCVFLSATFYDKGAALSMLLAEFVLALLLLVKIIKIKRLYFNG